VDLSTTNAITDAAPPQSQSLPIDPLAPDDPQVTIADFGHGSCSSIFRQYYHNITILGCNDNNMVLQYTLSLQIYVLQYITVLH
jgi:hypothetical protein